MEQNNSALMQLKCSVPEPSPKQRSDAGGSRSAALGLTHPAAPRGHQQLWGLGLEGIKGSEQWFLLSLPTPHHPLCPECPGLCRADTAEAGMQVGQCPMAAPALSCPVLPSPPDGHCLLPLLLSVQFPSLITECVPAHLKILLSGVVSYDFSETKVPVLCTSNPVFSFGPPARKTLRCWSVSKVQQSWRRVWSS